MRHAATATATPPNAMIIPASIDINGFSRSKDAVFNVTGIAGNGTPTNFPLANVFIDPMTNLQIGVHYPLMDYSQSSRNPRALANSGLSETVYIKINTDFFKAVMASAIIGSQGAGELMIAYPQSTAHTVEVAPEVMRMQMRAYLGAAVLQQENVIRVPYVFCEHIKELNSTTTPTDTEAGNWFDQGEGKSGKVLIQLSTERFTHFGLDKMVEAIENPIKSFGEYDSTSEKQSQETPSSLEKSVTSEKQSSQETSLSQEESFTEQPRSKGSSSSQYTTEGSSALFTDEETSGKKKKKGRT